MRYNLLWFSRKIRNSKIRTSRIRIRTLTSYTSFDSARRAEQLFSNNVRVYALFVQFIVRGTFFSPFYCLSHPIISSLQIQAHLHNDSVRGTKLPFDHFFTVERANGARGQLLLMVIGGRRRIGHCEEFWAQKRRK